MNALLPSALQSKLTELARRIRLAQALRGLGWLMLGVVAVQVLLFLADGWLGLEPRGLRVSWVILVAVAAGSLLFGLAVPLWRPLPARFLAALVEGHHPELEERLLTAVELSRQTTGAHGSPALVAQVIHDAGESSQGLDFPACYALDRSRRWLGLGALVLVVSLACAAVFPSYGGFQRDLWLAWTLPASGFSLQVAPGSKTVARDRPLTITVQPLLRWSRATVPTACVLVLHEKDAPAQRRSMTPGPDGGFSFTLDQVAAKQSYHVEAGGQVSDSFILTGVEPIRLAEGSPTLQVTPPPYVNAIVHPPSSLKSPVHFLALQYGTLRFGFQVNRAPNKATLLISGDADPAKAIPVPLTWNGQEGSATLPADRTGKFSGRLILEGEHGIVYEHVLAGWTVWKDDAPTVTERPMPGMFSTAAGVVAPRDSLPLKIGVEDAVGLDRVELEYRVNDGPVQTVVLAKAEGKLRLSRELSFPLAGKVKEGDAFSWRLKVIDNRKLARGQAWNEAGLVLPERDLGPHIVWEPAVRDGQDRWQVLKVTNQADPLPEQHILGQRDEVRKKIDALKLRLEQERAQLRKAKLSVHQQPGLTPEHAQQIEQVRDKNHVNQEALRLFGWELSADPVLQMLADRPLALAENEMARSDNALFQAGDGKRNSEEREHKLARADLELLNAVKGLERMQEANERLAQDRLDQARIELLASKQKDLADRAAELAARDLSKDPLAREELARLKEEQARLAAELERLNEQGKLFREAQRQARVRQAQQLAKQAEAMAQTQRELFQASRKAMVSELQNKLAELAKKQEALAGRAAALGRESKIFPGDPAPLFDEAKAAAASLREGQVENALRYQDRTINDFSALADSLGRTIVLGQDAREGANSMLRMQDRMEEQMLRFAEGLGGDPIQKRLLAFAEAQKMLQDNLGRLEIPGDLKEAQAQRVLAQMVAGKAAEAFRGDLPAALDKMKETLQAVRKLFQLLPANLPVADLPASPREKLVRGQAERADVLAKEQNALRDEVLKLLGEVAGGGAGKDSPLHGLAKKQEELQEQAERLGEDFMKLSQGDHSPEAKMSGKEASHAAEQAAKAMTESKDKMKEGKTTEAAKLAEEAALKLEIAGKQAAKSAEQMAAASLSPSQKEEKDDLTTKALTQAKSQMAQAQEQLQQGMPKSAEPAMRQSIRALKEAAHKTGEQLTQHQRASSSSPNSSKLGAAPGGVPTGSLLAKEMQKYGAKSWGDLPGDLRARIVQDMRSRYGEDYARIIQGYFQDIADETPRK